MIGNDIVDLAQAARDSDWKRKGYLDKLFTSEEQFLICSNKQPDRLVWLLWTMKEAAYKIESRLSKLREFAPVKIACNHVIIHKETASGHVRYNQQLYYTRSVIERNYIHTIAALSQEELTLIRIEILETEDHQFRRCNPSSVSHHGRYLAMVYA